MSRYQPNIRSITFAGMTCSQEFPRGSWRAESNSSPSSVLFCSRTDVPPILFSSPINVPRSLCPLLPAGKRSLSLFLPFALLQIFPPLSLSLRFYLPINVTSLPPLLALLQTSPFSLPLTSANVSSLISTCCSQIVPCLSLLTPG